MYKSDNELLRWTRHHHSFIHQYQFLQLQLLEPPPSNCSHPDHRPCTCQSIWNIISTQKKTTVTEMNKRSRDLSRTDLPSLYFWLFSKANSWSTNRQKVDTKKHYRLRKIWKYSYLHIAIQDKSRIWRSKYQQPCACRSSSSYLPSPQHTHSLCPHQIQGLLVNMHKTFAIELWPLKNKAMFQRI